MNLVPALYATADARWFKKSYLDDLRGGETESSTDPIAPVGFPLTTRSQKVVFHTATNPPSIPARTMINRSTTLHTSGFSQFQHNQPAEYRRHGLAESAADHQFAVLTLCFDEPLNRRNGRDAASMLASQIGVLREACFQLRSLRSVIDNVTRNEPLPQQTVVITIDARNAQPDSPLLQVLKTLEVPATVFLSTSPVEEQLEVDRQNWHRLVLNGLVDFGAQPTDPDVRTDPLAFHDDLRTCLDYLESEFGVVGPPFAFPAGSGRWDRAFEEIAMAAGAVCCLTDRSELVDLRSKNFSWGRLIMTESDSPAKIVRKLRRQFSTWSRVWRRLCSQKPVGCPRLPKLLADEIRSNGCRHGQRKS